MKVKELIRYLKNLDQNAKVLMPCGLVRDGVTEVNDVIRMVGSSYWLLSKEDKR